MFGPLADYMSAVVTGELAIQKTDGKADWYRVGATVDMSGFKVGPVVLAKCDLRLSYEIDSNSDHSRGYSMCPGAVE